MAGARRRRREEAEQARDLALMTAYYAGHLAQHDWKANGVPSRFGHFLSKLTQPQEVTAAERVSRFETLQRLGFAVQVNRTKH